MFKGPITPKGNVLRYTANGVAAFIITLTSFCNLSFGIGMFNAASIYDHFLEILGALNGFSLLVCFLLYCKGRYRPSSADSGTSGNLIFDYYWGTELYPMFGKINLKIFINCRLGMMSWAILTMVLVTP